MEAQTCVRQLFPENRMEQKVRFLQKVDEQSLSMQNNAPSKLLSLLFIILCESPEIQTGQNRSSIFWYLVPIEHNGKKIKSCMGVLLRANLTGHGQSADFC